jgi:hypothetical protein
MGIDCLRLRAIAEMQHTVAVASGNIGLALAAGKQRER